MTEKFNLRNTGHVQNGLKISDIKRCTADSACCEIFRLSDSEHRKEREDKRGNRNPKATGTEMDDITEIFMDKY